MASERGGQPRGPMVEVAADAAKLGYQAVELVFVGMRESVRLQSARASGKQTGRPPGAPAVPVRDRSEPAPTNLIGDVASIAAHLLSRAGSAAGEVAQTLTDQSGQARGGHESVPELEIKGKPGDTETLEFVIWNTGVSVLRDIKLSATDLVGADKRTPASAFTFQPAVVSQVGPGKSERVEVSIRIPAKLPVGTYRGLIQAEPGDSCAVIALEVSKPSTPST